MINKELIQNRIDNFWGYGNLDGSYWFIGMEEGHNLGNDILEKRFIKTFDKNTVDIIEGLSVIKDLKWFKPPFPPVQRTYKGYIIIKLFIELGRMPDIEEIRLFQLNQLGREFVNGKANDHSILELMPLPAPSTSKNDWPYKDFGIEDLSTRKKYLEKYKPIQIEKLHNLIKKHNPKLAVFYSTTYLEDWKKVADCDLIEIQKNQYMYDNGKTLFV